jgi:WD40 repeat protein
MMMK